MAKTCSCLICGDSDDVGVFGDVGAEVGDLRPSSAAAAAAALASLASLAAASLASLASLAAASLAA